MRLDYLESMVQTSSVSFCRLIEGVATKAVVSQLIRRQMAIEGEPSCNPFGCFNRCKNILYWIRVLRFVAESPFGPFHLLYVVTAED